MKKERRNRKVNKCCCEETVAYCLLLLLFIGLIAPELAGFTFLLILVFIVFGVD